MTEYRVLARKYRPSTFADLIGQEVLVRTLSNAIAANRLAHAFLLTGIRGVGKTTTARIISRALNCIGPDGQGGPTINPCGVCPNCIAIAEDRHVDVLEMDAASRTGVDDIRDIIDTVHYAPTSARYKIYIIDEVHMLSKNAFNALLKTLEEPPPHVKFIFATTELRKIPITILSRCQRFDLKRVDAATLVPHLQRVLEQEGIAADTDALQLIAGAAEGSVRDSLSILDQAIAHAAGENPITIRAELVAGMLGLTDRRRTLAILQAVLGGDIATALQNQRELYAAGADPLITLQEMLELTHALTLRKTGTAVEESTMVEQDRQSAAELAASVPLTALTQCWQMLLKGLQEAQIAPNPQIATEMILIRLAHMANLPPPGEIIRRLQDQPATAISQQTNSSVSAALQPVMQHATAVQSQPVEQPGLTLANFAEIVALFDEKREMLLHNALYRETRLVSFQPGRLELNMADTVPANTAGVVGQRLSEWTGQRWLVTLSREAGSPSLHELAEQQKADARASMAADPLVARVLELFPGATILSNS